jgi:ankyrin repeat protein
MGRSGYVRFLTVIVALAASLHAAEPVLSDQFYSAIRADDRPTVAKLLGGGADVNTRDARGNTPLMYAAAHGSLEMMRQLLAAGADAKAKNNLESTALMWCTANLDKVRLLVEKGANVNARSKQGRSPLVIAAAHDGNVEVLRLLIARGADVKAPGAAGANAALIAASGANDIAMVKLLIEHGADAKAKDPAGFTALIDAAGYGNLEAVKLLLARGADVNAQSEPSRGRPVKNGPIGIGSLTPLLMAVTAGNPEIVRLLLDAGADINVRDVRGMTPTMLAIATDHPNEKIVRMLLAKRPAMDAKSKANETALDWALKFQHPAILPLVRKASGGIEPAKREVVTPAHTSRDARQAAEKSMALLQKSTVSFLREGGCVSCHAQNITSVAVAAARSRGIPVDEAAASEVARGTRLQFAAFADGMLERLDPPAVEILIESAFGLAADRVESDRIIDAVVHNIAAQQHVDGSWWRGFGIVRPPTADSRVTGTALAIRVLRQYTPLARKAEFDERIARAASWLSKVEPATTEDAVMQMLGVKWSGGNVEKFGKRLTTLQRQDGGWAQTPYLKSDAYATATALYAMKEAGMPASDAAYQKGIRYLLSTQAEDGSWYVASRAPKFQPYFEGGFPYGHDEWISMWATGYAIVALTHTLPETRAAK